MSELEFWVMSVDSPEATGLQAALAEFERQSGIRVNLRIMDWDHAWSHLVRAAIYGKGPDVAEIGSSWLRDFVGMEELHPFSSAQFRLFGEPAEFIPALSRSVLPADLGQVWAVPWLAEARLLFYRRDWLEDAGIEEATAFESLDALERTLAALQAQGVAIPWVVPMLRTSVLLHNAAVWVWSAGGRFLSDDGRRVLFNQPRARRGLTAHFRLARYMPAEACNLSAEQTDALFCEGRAAATLGGPWILHDPRLPSVLLPRVGVTLPPGIPIVGGSHLVIWRPSARKLEAHALIQYLTGVPFLRTYAPQAGLFPAKPAALQPDLYRSHRLFCDLAGEFDTAQSFQPVPLWGLTEDRLVTTLADIWRDVVRTPDLDLDALLDRHLTPLARNLALTLGER
ncbi:MAG: extracellular solute-binding protein [Anaerolineae bacterium]|nr:extracellular solute-binding protein [Anaerolineae bacterium]